jgi:hypothetical protein
MQARASRMSLRTRPETGSRKRRAIPICDDGGIVELTRTEIVFRVHASDALRTHVQRMSRMAGMAVPARVADHQAVG